MTPDEQLDEQDRHAGAAELPTLDSPDDTLTAPSAAEFHAVVAQAAEEVRPTNAETRELVQMWQQVEQWPQLPPVDRDIVRSTRGELEPAVIAEELDLEARVAALDFAALGVDPARRWLDA